MGESGSIVAQETWFPFMPGTRSMWRQNSEVRALMRQSWKASSACGSRQRRCNAAHRADLQLWGPVSILKDVALAVVVVVVLVAVALAVAGGWWLVVVVVVVREKDWSPIRFTKKGHGARPYGPRSPKVVRGGEGWLYLTSNNNLVSGWAAMGRAGGEGAGGLKP